jgi:O-antigen/teichoic acid export membrane protein
MTGLAITARAKLYRFPTALAWQHATRRLLAFGGWLTISNLLTPMMTYLDRFAISGVVGVAALATYTVPYEVLTKFLLIPAAVSTVLFPKFAQATSREMPWERLYWGALGNLAIVMAALVGAALVMGKKALALWIDPSFASAASGVWGILAVGVFFNAVAHLPYAAVQAAGRADVTAKAHLVEAPVYFAVLIGATGAWGVEGAAVAWSGRMALDCLFLLWVAPKVAVRSDSNGEVGREP